MTGAELRSIRRRCGMGVAQFGRALGLGAKGGADDTVARRVRRLEARTDDLSAAISARAMNLESEVVGGES